MKVAAIVFAMVSFLFFFQIHPNYDNPNELSRFLLVSAIVDDHSLCIDHAIQRYGDTMDKSEYSGKLYCDKPIGYSILAVPFYWLLRQFMEPEAGAGFFLYILRIFLNLVPLSLFVIFFHKCLSNHLHLEKSNYFFSVALVFGSLLYPFGQLFLSHMLTAVCVFIGFCLCCHRTERKYSFFSGAIFGLGFLFEFPVMIAIVAIFVWMIVKRRSDAILFLFGVLLVTSFQFIYNYSIFDDPLAWPQTHMASEDIRNTYSKGYMGFSTPSVNALWGLTFGSTRGLFFFVPHLVFGIAGLARNSRNRSESILILTMIVLIIFYYGGFIIWDGGQSFGPRYLVLLIPLFVYGSAILFRDLSTSGNSRLNSLLFALYVACVAITMPNILFGTVTYPYPPRFLENPVLWLNITLFWRGFFGLNWGEYLGLSVAFIQILAILLLLVPSMFFIRQSLTRRYQALFFLIFIGFVGISKLFQPIIQANTDATKCFAIGRIGYIQGHYDKSIEFLNYARQRSPNPGIDNASKELIEYIRKNHQPR